MEPKVITSESWWKGTQEDQIEFQTWLEDHGLGSAVIARLTITGDDVEVEELGKTSARYLKAKRPLTCESVFLRQ